VVTPEAETGRPTRLAFVLQDDAKEYLSPKSVRLQFGPAPDRFTSPIVEARIFNDASPAPSYVTVEAELAPKGTVWAQATVDGRKATAPIMIVDARPGLGAGQTVPLVRTPSPGDAAGLEVVCTRSPEPCPWHDVSLDRAVGQGRPLAVLVATPAFCQTAICGPVLDLLVARQAQYADVVTMIHAEVYPNEAAAGRTTTDVVTAYGLPWEPSLFLALPDGTITNRLDYTFDQRELDEALAALVQ